MELEPLPLSLVCLYCNFILKKKLFINPIQRAVLLLYLSIGLLKQKAGRPRHKVVWIPEWNYESQIRSFSMCPLECSKWPNNWARGELDRDDVVLGEDSLKLTHHSHVGMEEYCT